jgi:hypothetical protein
MTVFFRPYGDMRHAPAPRNEIDKLYYCWLSEETGIDVEHDPYYKVDYEDWMEPMRMLEASIRLGLEIHILPRKPLHEAIQDPIAVILGKPSPHMLIGRRVVGDAMEATAMDFAWPDPKAEVAMHYAEMKTFQAHAGRRTQVCDMPGEKCLRSAFSESVSADAIDVGEAMAAHSGAQCIVKQVIPIKMIPNMTFDIPKNASPLYCEHMLASKLGYHIARMEGQRDALLVQEFVPDMTHETRFFVIGHHIATAAACIESDTPRPQIGPSAVLAPRFEVVRNSGDIVTDQALPDRMMAEATRIVAAFADEVPEMRSYVLDLCLMGGDVKIVELNPIADAGLYGIDTVRLMMNVLVEARLATPDFNTGIGQVPPETTRILNGPWQARQEAQKLHDLSPEDDDEPFYDM